MKIKRRCEWPTVVLGVVGSILLLSFLIGLGMLLKLERKTTVVDLTVDDSEVEPSVVDSEMKLLLAGTTFWGRRTNKLARASELGVAYPFAQLDSLARDEYDAWIAGLECPITDNGHSDYNENTLLKFNCDPDYLPEAAKWFDVFMLGTNHTDNWGVEGFATTKTYLDEAGIQYFGSYDYTDGVNNCDVIVLPLRVGYDDDSEEAISMPFGFCSAHGVYGVPTEAALQNMKKYAEVLPTIVMPHMGAEYKTSADEIRTNLYRKMIDYGAEMVIGDHPHWIQNTEAYNGRLIVYSMGNFMFDQNTAETVRSAAIEAVAKLYKGVDFETWQELGDGCLENKIDCFSNIVAANLPKLQVDWEFGYKGTTSAGDSVTRLASETEQVAIGQRLNWAMTLAGLK